jgi:hypothetical protein
MRSRHETRGVTLGVAIMVIFIAMTFAFSLAGMSTLHINMVVRVVSQVRARNLAESAMAIAVAQVMDNPKFGTDPTDPAQTVAVLDNGSSWNVGNSPGLQLPQPPYAGEGLLTFDTAAATTLFMPWSMNNLAGKASTVGWDARTIPGQTLHVAAMGVSGTERVAYEALIVLPPFPFALAASGHIVSTGNLLAASIPCPCSTSVIPYRLCKSGLGPANIGANGSAGNDVTLGPSQVNGDVDAVACVSLGACAVINGAVQAHHAPIDLPLICVPSQFLALSEYPNLQNLPAITGPLNGLCQYKGNLTVTGDLVLNSAVLFIRGNLVVTGGIHGVGAVFVQGTADIQGCSSLTASDVCALVAEGAVSLEGKGQGASYFQGMVYSSTSIAASNVTVMGNMVANAAALPNPCTPTCPIPACAPPNGSGNVCLTNVSVISALNNLRKASCIKSYMPPTRVTFGCQCGTGNQTWQIGFKPPKLGTFLGGFGSAGLGTFYRGCLNMLGKPCCTRCTPCACTCRCSCWLFQTGWQCTCPIVFCVRIVPCPPCGPIKHICISRQGKTRQFCFPLPPCQARSFLKNCVAPIIVCQQIGMCWFGWASGGVNQCTIICREIKQLPKMQVQVKQIVCYHYACTYTTQDVVNRCGYLFDMSWNQFLGLYSQMRVEYWAGVDASKLGGPKSGAW